MQLYGALDNRLKTELKLSGLTQEDLAFLLDEKLQRIEAYVAMTSTPLARSAIGLELIFSTPMRVLFEGIAARIRTEVAARAWILLNKLSDEQVTPENAERLAALARIARVDDDDFIPWRDAA